MGKGGRVKGEKKGECQNIWIRDYNLKYAIVKSSGQTKHNFIKV